MKQKVEEKVGFSLCKAGEKLGIWRAIDQTLRIFDDPGGVGRASEEPCN
jgi:hypothetical protein